MVEETSVAKIEEKKGMVFVHQLKEYKGMEGGPPVVQEVRIHVFRPALNIESPGEVSTKPSSEHHSGKIWLALIEDGTIGTLQPAEPPYDITFTYTPTLPLLFRFSALTFNAHRIHYDATWAREREGHSSSPYGGPVVHGPLSALVGVELVEGWIRESSEGRGKVLTAFEYRATSPMYVDREIEVVGKAGDGGKLTLWAVQDGKVGMMATATFE
jgi:acyl dehydratase